MDNAEKAKEKIVGLVGSLVKKISLVYVNKLDREDIEKVVSSALDTLHADGVQKGFASAIAVVREVQRQRE